MPNFDVAIALTQGELNDVTRSIYKAVYPDVFSGQTKIKKSGLTISVDWKITQAPKFDLSDPQDVASRVVDDLAERASRESNDVDNVASLRATAEAHVAAFEMSFPEIEFTTDDGDHENATLKNVRADCRAKQHGNTVSFIVEKISAKHAKGPSGYIVEKVILPAMKKTLNKLFSGLKIPPPQLAHAKLSSLALAIENGHLCAAANLSYKGSPSPPRSVTWAKAPFSVLVSRDALQAAGQDVSKHKKDSGSGGKKPWGAYHWSYGYRLDHPHISIAGEDLHVTFELQGSIDAGVEVMGIPIGIGYAAHVLPEARATCKIEPRGTDLHIVTKSVTPFTVVVKPTGSVPSRVGGWMLEGIAQGVAGSLSPMISAFLGGIDFASIDVPTYEESISGHLITMTPSDLSVSNELGDIALSGSLKVSTK